VIVVARAEKHAGERKPLGFELTDFCSRFWSDALVVPTAARYRPVPQHVLIPGKDDVFGRGTVGYEYECLIEGQTGTREPRWADGIQDGSITWLQRAISSASLFRTVAGADKVEWITDGNITVSSTAVVAGSVVQVSAFHSGGIEGEIHRVIARITFTDGSIEDFAIDWSIVDDEIE
jgi:hypothetical protein